MDTLKKYEIIKFHLYGISAFYRAMNAGHMPEDKARRLAAKQWENLDKQDVLQYFKNKDFQIDNSRPLDDDPVPVAVYDEIASECWDALEFFGML